MCNKPVNRDHRRFDERRSESGVFQVNGRQADGDALSRRGSTEPPAAQFLSLAILLPFLPLLSHRIKPENDLERDTIDKSVCICIYKRLICDRGYLSISWQLARTLRPAWRIDSLGVWWFTWITWPPPEAEFKRLTRAVRRE